MKKQETELPVPGKTRRFSKIRSVICRPIQRGYKYMIKGVLLSGIFSGIIALGGMDALIHSIITANRVIKSGTIVWEVWRTMPIDIYMKLYMFNITNPEEFANGAKAKLREMGPYVFLIDLEKVDLFENDTDKTIRYRMLKWQTFQPHLSKGSIDDKITFVNAVFVIAAAVVRENLDDDFFRQQFDELLSSKGERLYRTEKVRDLLFDGINIRTYTEFLDNPIIMDTAKEMGFAGLPPNIANNTFALFKGTNGTDDGWLVVHSGADDTDLAGVVISHNGNKKMTAWRGGKCNEIHGTDATFLPPTVSKTEDWQFFVTLVCRSVSLSYLMETETKGVPTWKFSVSKMFQAPKSNPDNWCYCPVLRNETGTCQDDGIASLAPCFFGAPVFVSQPHFYGAERWIQKAVEGLRPNLEKHVSTVEIHPFTAVPLLGWGRFQLAVELIPYEEMPSFSDVRHAYIPIAWLEMGAEAENWHAKCFMVLNWVRKGFLVTCCIFIAGGLVLLGIGVVMIKGKKKGGVGLGTIIAPKPENPKGDLWAVKVVGEATKQALPPLPLPATSPPATPTSLNMMDTLDSYPGYGGGSGIGADFQLTRKTKVKAVCSKRSKQALRSLKLSR